MECGKRQSCGQVLSWVDSMACCTSSSDGTVKLTDLDTGFSRLLVDLNPQGWTEGGPFSMVYGCTADASHGTIYAGDSDGRLHMLDPRSNNTRSMSFQAHKKDKIVSVDVHPLNPNIIMTAGNDRSTKLFDVRAIPWGPTDLQDVAGSSPHGADVTTGSASGKQQSGRHASASGGAGSSLRGELANMVHTKVVNSAYFSPITGRKILTTCQDNRIRVWDNLLDVNSPPSREIVHSNDFNRYLTPFRAEWDPKDYLEERFIVGRYISEDYNGKALHPIDIMDASTGCLLQELVDTNLTTISPVNKMHPTREVIITGSSRSLFLWRPMDPAAVSESASSSSAGSLPALVGGHADQASDGSKGGFKPTASSKFVFCDVEPADAKKNSTKTKASGAVTGKRKPGDDGDSD
ncbi:hypothetical protein CEUSTIGMA_g11042.t1 [Chlamydomonas eustigma]|uniref:Uncharacterized protein n=1 Tax=Chlamydomonas eustigma TaxID=1157962 RepID=A0A250XKL9_9CHLO|nr:hypothetical protein CEUSTIGMA_g11042.t1 [Chlamydomonas eustigma]|eukprot:GAX83618.1 hypothetical protein CEUSTIGMA_g11042.t1 [Chlamydomonas eustigma]